MARRRDPGAEKGRRAFLRRLGASVAASVAAPVVAGAGKKAAKKGKKPRARSGKAVAAKPPARPAVTVRPPRPPVRAAQGDWPVPEAGERIDLAPARWIWLPSQRTLASTFVLFRREIELGSAPVEARGWISADSRYRLFVNGRRVQFGPAPCDPRRYEADPARPHARGCGRAERGGSRGPLLRPRRGHVARRESRASSSRCA